MEVLSLIIEIVSNIKESIDGKFETEKCLVCYFKPGVKYQAFWINTFLINNQDLIWFNKIVYFNKVITIT